MIPAERQQRILDWLERDGYVSTAELVEYFGVSSMTIWRDLQRLDDQGMLMRVRGGAEKLGVKRGRYAPQPLDLARADFSLPEGLHQPERQAIGKYVAAHLVEPHEAIILEGGTTVASMIPFLAAKGLTAITNGLNTLVLAQLSGTIESILCCGGMLDQRTKTFIGPDAEGFFGQYQVDKVFVSAFAFMLGEGFFDPTPRYDSMKRTMCSRADQTIMLIDSGKVGRRGLVKVFDMESVDILVTDEGIRPKTLDGLRTVGVDVRVAPLGA